MSRRMIAPAAIALWLAAMSLSAAAVALGVMNQLDLQTAFADFLPGLMLDALTFSTVGALIVMRRPGQAIGWLFCAAGVGAGLEVLAGEYARFGLVTQSVDPAPAASVAAWFVPWGWMVVFGVPVMLLVLLFPTGHLPSAGWRPVAWLCLGSMLVAAGLEAFGTDVPTNGPVAPNPFGLEPIPADITRLAPVLFLPGTAAMVGSVIARYRSAGGHERVQLKWFMYAAVLTVVAVSLGPDLLLLGFLGSDALVLVDGILGAVAFPCLAIAVAIAILRHRLYDIDRLIKRTLVYAALSGSLAFTYWTGVIVLQALLRPVTPASDLAVAASTLGVIGLFRPLHVRIQTLVDRRFDRQKYDAARTLSAFGARMRDEVELESLTAELLEIVRRTM